MGTPIPHRENERRGVGSGPVTSYTLTPEQMEALFPSKKDANRPVKPLKLQKEEKPVPSETKITKEDYLRLIAEGWDKKEIAKKYGISTSNLNYYYLRRWGLAPAPPADPTTVPKQSATKKPQPDPIPTATAETAPAPFLPAEPTAEAAAPAAVSSEPTEPKSEPAKTPVAHDPVRSPSHYTFGGIETIDYIKAKLTPEQYKGYLYGNLLKYISRFPHKDGLQDLEKTQTYLEWLMKEVGSQ